MSARCGSALESWSGGAVGLRDLSGPVGIVNTMSQVGSQSPTAADAARSLLDLAALIAVNLAVMNLLPLPALDGGRIFPAAEWGAVRPVPKKDPGEV